MFVGPPGSGKTPTVKVSVKDPFKEIGGDWPSLILDRGTVSALADQLAESGSVFLVNTEFHEVLCRSI